MTLVDTLINSYKMCTNISTSPSTKISRLNGGIFCCPDSLLSLKKGVYQSFKARLPKEKHYVNLNHYDVYTLYIKYPIQYFDSKDKEKFNDETKKIDFWTLFDIF